MEATNKTRDDIQSMFNEVDQRLKEFVFEKANGTPRANDIEGDVNELIKLYCKMFADLKRLLNNL